MIKESRPLLKLAGIEEFKEDDEQLGAGNKVKETHTSELVIALCGPIGSPVHAVAKTLEATLAGEFGYDCRIIRLSNLIIEFGNKGSHAMNTEFERIKSLIDLGNELRKNHGHSVLAELAIHQIHVDRQKKKIESESPKYEPRRVCHIIDSIKNQEELDILKVVYRDMLYCIGVFSPLPSRAKNLEKRGMSQPQIYELIDQDSGEEQAYGQTVRETFPQSDFFLRIDSDTDSPVKGKVERFIHLILNTKIITPSAGETAMYLAASAAGNSACLSRQVGAALTDQKGEILSVGWNDVPKAGGNLYMSDPFNDPTNETDKRCWNRDGGTCFNDQEKNIMAESIVSDLKDFINEEGKKNAIEKVLENSKLRSLIEFSRAIHAEMHAIILGSQSSGKRVNQGKMYCTTYPCHSCARHIVAAGITEVYYIEPYRKSLATKLHDDAITESETDTQKVRILPYDGVAPTRYLTLFRMRPDSRKANGKMIIADLKKAPPKFDKSLEALPVLEAVVVTELGKKKLV